MTLVERKRMHMCSVQEAAVTHIVDGAERVLGCLNESSCTCIDEDVDIQYNSLIPRLP